jgi:hypothetical protein
VKIQIPVLVIRSHALSLVINRSKKKKKKKKKKNEENGTVANNKTFTDTRPYENHKNASCERKKKL